MLRMQRRIREASSAVVVCHISNNGTEVRARHHLPGNFHVQLV